MKKKLIKISKNLCIGCGKCVNICSGGVLKIIDGVAKLVLQHSCDGIGACIETCPNNALTIEEKELDSPNIIPDNPSFNYKIKTQPLNQWPLQLYLINPKASFFKDKQLTILSTCSPVACSNIHSKYINGGSIVIACPKLDETKDYIKKLTELFIRKDIPQAIVLRMIVPCCGGLTKMAHQAKLNSKRKDIVIKEYTLNLEGKIHSIYLF